MADILPNSIDMKEVRARWGAFAWTQENEKQARVIVGRYPPGRQQSAIIPLLDLAQRQVGAETETQGWLPVPVIEYVAAYLGMPYMRAYEVAGMGVSYGLQALDVNALAAKAAGLATVGLVLLLFWRRAARA